MGALNSIRGVALGVGLCVLGGSCAPAISTGVCNTADGGAVDTYQIYGKWKKLTPYNPPRGDEQLGIDFELLIVESGAQTGTTQTPICAADIVNRGFSSTLYRGVYEHDVTNNQISVEYTGGDLSGSSDTVSYSFSGSCSDTQMTLSYTSGLTETYSLYATDVESGSCADDSVVE